MFTFGIDPLRNNKISWYISVDSDGEDSAVAAIYTRHNFDTHKNLNGQTLR